MIPRSASCAALVAGLFASGAAAQVHYMSAVLDGAHAVPANTTTGSAIGLVRLDGSTNSVSIIVHHSGLSSPPASAELLRPTSATPLVLTLSPGPGSTLVGSAILTPSQVTGLFVGVDLNVPTTAFPAGEVRGPVTSRRTTHLTALLDGAQVVPPVTTAATGRAVGYLHQPDRRLVYMVDTVGISNPTSAAIHSGAVGANGSLIVGLDGIAGSWWGVTPQLSVAEVATLVAGDGHVAIGSTAVPGGEIRGQLRPAASSSESLVYMAQLQGLTAIPPNASAGVGSAQLLIDAGGSITITVSHGGLSGPPTAVRVRNGGFTVNGPVVVTLHPSLNSFATTFVPTPAELAELRAAQWSVNIETLAFPGGEVRGMLGSVQLPTVFGPRCVGSSGLEPEISATGFAAIGAPMLVEAFGVPPGALSILFFGVPGPNLQWVSFASLGLAAPCFFLVDPLATQLRVADVRGYASMLWNVPFDPAVRRMEVTGQWLVIDPPANASGLVVTNAISLPVF